MTAVTITEYAYTATRKYHDFDQSAATETVPASYTTLESYIEEVTGGGNLGFFMDGEGEMYFNAQRQVMRLKKFVDDKTVGNAYVIGIVKCPTGKDESKMTVLRYLKNVCEEFDRDYAEDSGFDECKPENNTKNRISLYFTHGYMRNNINAADDKCKECGCDTHGKSNGVSNDIFAYGKLYVTSDYSKITFDKDTTLSNAESGAGCVDAQMNNYNIFTQEV